MNHYDDDGNNNTTILLMLLYRFCFCVLVAVDDGENDGDEAVKK
jgi:hypothetical protein